MLASACGGGSETTEAVVETSTTSSTTTTTTLPGEVGEVVDEASLVVPPILLKPLIGATGILTSTGDDWEVISAIVPLEMGVKIRTADNGTAQMTFEDGSALLMGGNSVINVRSFDYDEEAGARVLTVDVISGSIAYDIFSEGLTASLAKIVTPTAELSVHGTEGVFEYDVSTFSAKSTVLEGGEENDDAVFSELLPDEGGNPVLVAISQTAGTELGSATTGGSGWVEQDSSTVALIVDDFVSNMEGDCSYTCKAETQEGLADGSEGLNAENAVDAVFTEGDSERMQLASTLLTAAGAPEEITGSVQELAEAVADVAVPEEELQEFISNAWETPPEGGEAQELPPTEFFNNFGDAAQVYNSEEFEDLGFDHEEHGDFRSQHGMMQFISADTNAVNELAQTGDVASAMALAASNMFVNADAEGFEEGTYCYDNPDDAECLSGQAPSPEFLAQAFAGNHFVEDMVQDMGFEYSFTENDIKPEYCDDEPWHPECADGPQFYGDVFEEGGDYCIANPDDCGEGKDAGAMFFGGGHEEGSYCYDNPDDAECMGGNASAVYEFFHVYNEDVLGDDWEPVDCNEWPDDPMCTGEGDFFHQHVGDASAIALDRSDMFDIYGGPQELTGPPPEFCAENPDAPECAADYKAADVYSEGQYIPPGYCDETPDAPECDPNFGQGGGLQGPLTGDFLAQYAAPDPNARAGIKPGFCTETPDHPECFRDYYNEEGADAAEFLGGLFSDESYVDLAKQGVYYNSIDGADELASQRYGSHDDYYVLDCSDPENVNEPGCSEDFDPTQFSLYAGAGEGDAYEYESFNEENVDEICSANPQDPVCFAAASGGLGPSVDCEDPENADEPACAFQSGGQPPPPSDSGGFWGNADQASQFQDQAEAINQFCEENPNDPACNEGYGGPSGIDCSAPGNQNLPECGGGSTTFDCSDPAYANNPQCSEGGQTPEEYCNENPDDPYCQNPSEGGGQGGQSPGGGPGGPPEQCSDPAYANTPECVGGSGGYEEDCQDNPFAPGCDNSDWCNQNPDATECQNPTGPPPEGNVGGGGPGYSGDNVDCAANPDDPACGEGYGGPSGIDCSIPENSTRTECGGGGTTFDCSDPAYAGSPECANDTATGDQGTAWGSDIDCSDPAYSDSPECGGSGGDGGYGGGVDCMADPGNPACTDTGAGGGGSMPEGGDQGSGPYSGGGDPGGGDPGGGDPGGGDPGGGDPGGGDPGGGDPGGGNP